MSPNINENDSKPLVVYRSYASQRSISRKYAHIKMICEKKNIDKFGNAAWKIQSILLVFGRGHNENIFFLLSLHEITIQWTIFEANLHVVKLPTTGSWKKSRSNGEGRRKSYIDLMLALVTLYSRPNPPRHLASACVSLKRTRNQKQQLFGWLSNSAVMKCIQNPSWIHFLNSPFEQNKKFNF